jgi:hypothetical protein
MSLSELQQVLRNKVIETAAIAFKIELDQIASELPPKIELGDLAFPVAFFVGKKIKQ